METVSNIFIVLLSISMVITPILFLIWIIKLIFKRPAKRIGKATLICAICGVVFLFVGAFTSPQTYCEHNYILLESEIASCEKDGFKKYQCDLCGKNKTDEVNMLGHDMVDVRRVEPSYDHDGEYTRKCNRCGYEQTEVLEKLITPTTLPIETQKPAETNPTTVPSSVPETSDPEIIEEEYKSSCKVIDYKDLCRYSEKYIGECVCVKVKIMQIMDVGLFKKEIAWHAYTDNSGFDFYFDDEYYLLDKRDEGSVKILEDDIIVVYGEFTGLKKVTRALTLNKEEVPCIEVKYLDLSE